MAKGAAHFYDQLMLGHCITAAIVATVNIHTYGCTYVRTYIQVLPQNFRKKTIEINLRGALQKCVL